eukprot:scaffold343428_cov41-Prasinocladus_malaysianus.AAC.1
MFAPPGYKFPTDPSTAGESPPAGQPPPGLARPGVYAPPPASYSPYHPGLHVGAPAAMVPAVPGYMNLHAAQAKASMTAAVQAQAQAAFNSWWWQSYANAVHSQSYSQGHQMHYPPPVAVPPSWAHYGVGMQPGSLPVGLPPHALFGVPPGLQMSH